MHQKNLKDVDAIIRQIQLSGRAKVLDIDFYQRADVVAIARELIGKVLVTNFDGERTAGIITETEAYAGITDRASHAWNNRRTPRTEIMYGAAGHAYVYLCYGIHSLFNVVTNTIGIPHAVLIRAIHPIEGVEVMLRRAKRTLPDKTFGKGPGKVSKILGIHYSNSGLPLTERSGKILIEDRQVTFPADAIKATPRIGIQYAGADVALPYRFVIE
ncbi:MAG: DNA-3-methyladenine glycosylase [Bacteroidales bacterium]|nr:DNA-3-methyladenine glycosylase [Bacteroidales bacterium]MDD3131416.1 DNA-3-methyladenine glycosylase [Bacteroidales bacterium]NLO51273.1 DNA-3-methyladenine glycosylase [Bacteroidales bacterium]